MAKDYIANTIKSYEILEGFDLSIEVLDYEKNFAKKVFNTIKSTWPTFDNLEYEVSNSKVQCLIEAVLDKQLNPSLLDFGEVQLQIKGMSRVGMAQITRQRSAVFNVTSQCAETKDHVRFIRPLNWPLNNKETFDAYIKQSVELYNNAILEGLPPQDARYILPQCVECGFIVWNTSINQIKNIANFRLCNTASPDENNLVIRKYIEAFKKQLINDYNNSKIDVLTYELYTSLLYETDAKGSFKDEHSNFNSIIKNSKRFIYFANKPHSIAQLEKFVSLDKIDFQKTQFYKELQSGRYLIFNGEKKLL